MASFINDAKRAYPGSATVPPQMPSIALSTDPNWPEGNPAPLRTNPVTGGLKVEVSGAGSGGTSATDGDAFVAGASAGTPLMGENGTALRIALINAVRSLVVQLANSSGTEIGTLSNPIRNTTVGSSDVRVGDGSGNYATITGGKLDVNATLSGSNPAASATGAAVPASGSYDAINVGGTLRGVTGVNPTGTVYAAQMDIASLGGTAVTTALPVSAITLPLPSGASTSAAQTTGNASLASIDGKITAVNTGAVVVSSSVLPTGASTAAKQDTGNTSLSSIDGKITVVNTGAVVVSSSALPIGASTAAKQPALGTAGTASADVITVQGITAMTPLKVDGSGSTQPISGTVTANIGTSGSLALDATLTGGTQKTKLVDSGGTNVATVSSGGALKVDPSAVTSPVSLASVPLPTGASTETTLSALNTKVATAITTDYDTGAGTQTMQMLGIALPASGGSVAGGTATNPIQVSLANTGANSTAVKVDGSAVTQPVSGTVTTTPPANASTNVAQINGVTPLMGNGVTGTGSPRVTIASDNTAFSVNAVQSGTWTVQPGNTANTTAWKVDGSAVTQPVSGTVTTTPPSNASTNIAQINGITPLMGNGVTGTGAQRVTISSDNTAFSVNANAGTNLNTSALALETGGNLATVAGAVVSQEATTSGVKGVTVFGAVTTNSPSYTTAKSDALSLDTSGLLRVSIKDTPANTNKFLVTPDSVALPANQSVNISQMNAVTVTMGNGVSGTGVQRVAIASDNTAFTVNAAQSGTWTVQPGNTANTTAWLTSAQATTAGGCSISRTLSAANTTGINAKASAGQVYGWIITNTNASARFVKLYNKASAPTVGTDTPVMTLVIPGSATGAGMVASDFSTGIVFATGIGYGITTGVADNDTGAPAANEVIVNLLYK